MTLDSDESSDDDESDDDESEDDESDDDESKLGTTYLLHPLSNIA